MGISTVSFNQAKIFKNRMFFTLYGKDGVFTSVFDNNGKNLLNRISYRPKRNIKGDIIIISRKNEYEFAGNTVFELIERIYDKAGKLLNINKQQIK